MGERAAEAFLALDAYLRRREYRGYEFDDLLGSPLVARLTGGRLLLQRVAIQVGELAPFNIRPLVGVRRLESTKARGFIAKGYLARYLETREEVWLSRAVAALDWLLEHRSPGHAGFSWGNDFAFASRSGFFPKGLPTVVWTSHIAEAFELGYLVTRDERYLAAVCGAGEFVARSLERHTDERGTCLAYAPGLLKLIHNSNLLGAAALLRATKYGAEPAYLELARSAYAWTIAHMNADGSWPYGVESNHRWVDNFHTAYNLDCLAFGHETAGEAVVPSDVIERAYRFWVRHFFTAEGAPKYYPDRLYPLDIQCAAQAIETLAKIAHYFPPALSIAGRVLDWTLRTMRKRNGAFRYQIRRFWKNDLESLHWGESTMLSALGIYLLRSAGRGVTPGEVARSGG